MATITKHQLLNQLIQVGKFNEARRLIKTLNHPKQEILLWKVNLAESMFKQKATNRLIDKLHQDSQDTQRR